MEQRRVSKFVSSSKVGIRGRIQSESLHLVPHHDHTQFDEDKHTQDTRQKNRSIRHALGLVLTLIAARVAGVSLLAVAVGLAGIKIELAKTSLAAQRTSGQAALYNSRRTIALTDRAAVDGVNGHLVDAGRLEDGLLVGNVVLVVLAGELQPERAGSSTAAVVISVDVEVVHADGGIGFICTSHNKKAQNRSETSEYSRSWHPLPDGGRDHWTEKPGKRGSAQAPRHPGCSKPNPLQPW